MIRSPIGLAKLETKLMKAIVYQNGSSSVIKLADIEKPIARDDEVLIKVAGSTRGGYLKDMAFTPVDVDHHIVAFTFVLPDGKPIPLRGEFQRTK